MQFDFLDTAQISQSITAEIDGYRPTTTPNTRYAEADMGDALEITDLGSKRSVQIVIKGITNQLTDFESLCDALTENHTVTVSNPGNQILLRQGWFPYVARRKENSAPEPEYESACNTFSLTLDLIIIG